MTKVINMKDAPQKWRTNPNYLYIGRANKHFCLDESIWCNPFPLSKYDRPTSLAMYSKHVYSSPELLVEIPELEGKILVCYCKPLDCHGDFLSSLANQPELRLPPKELIVENKYTVCPKCGKGVLFDANAGGMFGSMIECTNNLCDFSDDSDLIGCTSMCDIDS